MSYHILLGKCNKLNPLYCVAWVNTPPLGAQYLSRYPVRLRRGGLHSGEEFFCLD